LYAWALRLLPPAYYLLAATALVTFYTQRAVWLAPGMAGWTNGEAPFPFRYRALPMWIAQLGADALGPSRLPAIYFGIATLSAWGTLLACRELIATWLPRRLAAVLALGVVFPLAWHYAILNNLYFPFDLPAVFLFTAGWLFCLRRVWWGYYAAFLLGCFNRETILFLSVLFGLTWFRRLRGRELALHLAAQLLVYAAAKAVLREVFASPEGSLFATVWWKNRSTYLGLLTLRENGLKDWLKLLLAFGGFWWLLPFIWKRQPPEVKRALLLVPVFVLALQGVATMDEMRIYAELQPVIALPVLLALGGWLVAEHAPAGVRADSGQIGARRRGHLSAARPSALRPRRDRRGRPKAGTGTGRADPA